MIERLPVGKYTLREESAPYGYKVASDVTVYPYPHNTEHMRSPPSTRPRAPDLIWND